jgi:dCMP deaminase
METATTFAQRSTCTRGRVGVVIAHEARIVMTGYNGAPPGLPHCDHTCADMPGCTTITSVSGPETVRHDIRCPMGMACTTAIHAEANAIANAARYGVAIAGATLFTTMTPCLPCAQLVVAAGIISVWYLAPYRVMTGAEFLTSSGVSVAPWYPASA